MKSIVIKNSQLRVHLRADLGACIEGMWAGERPVLRSGPLGSLTDVRLSASYPLVPYSNRIAQATLNWEGQTYHMPHNFPPETHCIHGLGWQREWQVLDSSETACKLGLVHAVDPHWPFPFEAWQSCELQGAVLHTVLSITNRADTPAPVGLGWHPNFVKRPQARIDFQAQGMWGMDAVKLPTDLQPSPGLQRSCAGLDIDNCFEGWSGQATLEGDGMRVQVSSEAKRLVVYTMPSIDFIAIEPVSHANNAMNAGNSKESERHGVVVLAPGQSHTLHMSIQVHTA